VKGKNKIYLDEKRYLYRYQFKFIRNVIKRENKFSSFDLQEFLDKMIVYNLISEIQDKDEEAAQLVWFEEEDSVAFQFPNEGEVVSSLSSIGYGMSDDEDEWA